MAGSKKISELNNITVIDVADVLPIVDISDTETKYITVQQLDDRYLNTGSDFETAWDARLATKDSDNLTEGSTNQYYTELKVTNHPQVSANSAKRHDELTIGVANGLSLDPFTQILNMDEADSVTKGVLNPTDWNTFNGKQDVLPNADTGTDGILLATDWNTFNNKLDGSPYDGLETEFPSVLENQAAPAVVTGLQFNANARAVMMMFSIEVDATVNQWEYATYIAINKGGSWEMSQASLVGDTTGIFITISGSGQVEYTSPPITGFNSAKFKYRYFTLTV